MVTKRPASQCLGRCEFIIYIQKYKRECIYACIFVCIVFTLSQGPEQEPGTNPVLCLVVQSCLSLCDPMDCSSPGSAVHGDSPGKNTGEGSHSPSPGDLPNPGIKPRSPSGRFFTVWATREALLQPNWLLVSSHPSGLTSVLLGGGKGQGLRTCQGHGILGKLLKFWKTLLHNQDKKTTVYTGHGVSYFI